VVKDRTTIHDATKFLHPQHGDWPSAQADYLKARELAPGLAEIDYYLGTLHLRSGKPEQAETGTLH